MRETDSAVRGPLQHGTPTQRDRVHYAGRHAGGVSGGDPRGTRPKAGGSTSAAAKAPAGSGMSRRVTMTLPGETEVGSAGMQPGRGIAWRAHRDDAERGSSPSRSSQKRIGSVDPYALKIPAPKGRNTYYRWNASLHFTLNRNISFLQTRTLQSTLIRSDGYRCIGKAWRCFLKRRGM